MKRHIQTIAAAILIGIVASSSAAPAPRGSETLEQRFLNPPDEARPWVFWFWINGNISKEGITHDLESMKRAGINGVIWMEVSGPNWAPAGPVEPGSEQWHDLMQWAISEADRLQMTFDLTFDFGYGCGGPHIKPDTSMQKLVWSETSVTGGNPLAVKLEKPEVDYMHAVEKTWLRPGEQFPPDVMQALRKIDSYRDIAVFAIPAAYRKPAAIPQLEHRDGRGRSLRRIDPLTPENLSAVPPRRDVIDLTGKMDASGELRWSPPKGNWLVIRLGHCSNFHMTRPCPQGVVGLECDRLHPRGIETHFRHHLKPILERAGDKAGRTLRYIHVDSWEARGQNWTSDFAETFAQRRGYDIRPWLPVLAGYGVESIEKTERFLRDMRRTVSEVTMSAFIERLKELIAPYGVQLSCEPYGNLGANQLEYAARADFPIGEFWTERKDPAPVPIFSDYWYHSMKALASIANTYGKKRVGAEAFTGARGWMDHPYLLKSMGDEAFSQGISLYVIHLSAHQAYDQMKPGLTHRRWGQHFNRHQTWWGYSKPYFDYVSRCQLLLQQGRRVVDVACLYEEGAPLDFNDLQFELPSGHDYDLCTPEIIRRMEVTDGRIHLPTGVSYRYLCLPESGRLTPQTSRKVEELRQAGASIYTPSPIAGTAGLEAFPETDSTVRTLARSWPMLPEGGWPEVFGADGLNPDFQGDGLNWIHRTANGKDIYFVANPKPEAVKRECHFRITGKRPELWNPETGNVHSLDNVRRSEGRTSVKISFEPAQSWFVVFSDSSETAKRKPDPMATEPGVLTEVNGPWQVTFDPQWGGPPEPVVFDALVDWSRHADPAVHYYSGTAVYRKTLILSEGVASGRKGRLFLDLGAVEVMARVRLNGKDCGIAWKPPYIVDISKAARPGENRLEIDVVNLWINRMIGDEQLPLDGEWKDFETLLAWPDWFKAGKSRPSGRYTFTTCRHYMKDTPLVSSGLLGPVNMITAQSSAREAYGEE